MSTRDLHNPLTILRVFGPATSTGAVAKYSSVVDRRQVHAVEFVVTKGANTATAATVVVTVQHGSTNTASDHSSATSSLLLGDSPKTMTATTAQIHTVGYLGVERYVSVKMVQGAATGKLSVVAITARAKT